MVARLALNQLVLVRIQAGQPIKIIPLWGLFLLHCPQVEWTARFCRYVMWYVYIIEKDKRLYTGMTTDIKNRLRQHGNSPLLYQETFNTKQEAASREKQIKGWRRQKKFWLKAKSGE